MVTPQSRLKPLTFIVAFLARCDIRHWSPRLNFESVASKLLQPGILAADRGIHNPASAKNPAAEHTATEKSENPRILLRTATTAH
jgi:hypothetical protein